MPSGKDITGGGSAGGGGKRNGGGNMSTGSTGGAKKNAYCSFCRKSYRDVGPLVEGPGDVYICGDCIELCQSILDQERRRRGSAQDALHRHPDAARDQGTARRLRDRPGARQEGAVGRRPQPLQATGPRRGSRDRGRARQVEYPPDRAHRLRQDLAGPDPGPRAERSFRDRRRNHLDRGRIRRRGRREHPAQAAARRRLRPRIRPAGHRLHRRDRQDRQDHAQRLDHPRRLRRGRPAGPLEDARRHRGQRAAPGRPQASRAAVYPDGHQQYPVHLRRDVRRPGAHHRPPRRAARRSGSAASPRSSSTPSNSASCSTR